MSEATRQTVLFQELFDKPVVVAFDAPLQSSDGGALLLAAADRRLRLTEQLCGQLVDAREQRKVHHGLGEMLRQRVYGIALGYADGNDSARNGDDPLLKLACGRSIRDQQGLASQPTLSRFEHSVAARQLVAMGRTIEAAVIRQLKRRHHRARLITIDLDPTDDPTHGQQDFSFFNGHYDSWCFLPLLGFLSIDDQPEQYLFHARLRPGNASATRTAAPLLRRTVARLRRSFPRAKIRVRLDGGFAHPRLFDLLEELRVEYLVAMPSNSLLLEHAEPAMRLVRHMVNFTGQALHIFDECIYRAKSWSVARRVVIKAEVVCHPGRKPKDNARFVVSNLDHMGAERVYQIYRQRGDVENRIKELHHDLEIDRTSTTSYLSNHLRVLLTATAYVLCQELRSRLAGTALQRVQVGTLRLRLFKVATLVQESVRRIVLSMPASFPWKSLWLATARRVGAAAT